MILSYGSLSSITIFNSVFITHVQFLYPAMFIFLKVVRKLRPGSFGVYPTMNWRVTILTIVTIQITYIHTYNKFFWKISESF